MLITDFESQHVILSSKIPAGQALSAAIDLRGFLINGILVPAVGTAAVAALKCSLDGVAFVPLVNQAGVPSTVIGAIATFVGFGPINPANNTYYPPQFVKLWSETAGIDVPQVADYVFFLDLMPDPRRRP